MRRRQAQDCGRPRGLLSDRAVMFVVGRNQPNRVTERSVMRVALDDQCQDVQHRHTRLRSVLLGSANRGRPCDTDCHLWDIPRRPLRSLSVYTPYGSPFTTDGISSSLPDYKIAPEHGSTNPWRADASAGGKFEVTIRSDVSSGQANVLPLPSGTTAQHPGYLVYRVYLPTVGDFSHVKLPTLTMEKGSASTELSSCSVHTSPVLAPEKAPATTSTAVTSAGATPPAGEFYKPSQKTDAGLLANADVAYAEAYVVRPPAPHRYSPPRGFSRLGFSLTPAAPTRSRAHQGEGFPRSAPEPEPRSRHLCAGHPSGQQAGTRQTLPRATTGPWFRIVVATLSTFHQWFTHVRLLSSHLTHHVRLFRNAHHHGSFTAAACGGLRPPPARAVPEGLPPSPVQHRIQKNSVYIGTSLSVRGTQSSAKRTMITSPCA